MTIENAKEFLVVLADDDEAAARVDAAYVAALRAEAASKGFEVSDEDLTTALAEMTGLGDDELEEVSGFIYRDSLFWFKAPTAGFGNPLGFQTRKFGR